MSKIHKLEKYLSEYSDIILTKTHPGSIPYITSRLHRLVSTPVIIITTDNIQAKRVFNDLHFYTDKPKFIFPSLEILPVTNIFPSTQTLSSRISALYGITTESDFILVTSFEGMCEPTISTYALEKSTLSIKKNQKIDRDKLINTFIDFGYERVSTVQNIGEFSIKGPIIDIYTPLYDLPIRIDTFSELVDEIRFFDPITQLSKHDLNELDVTIILPVNEIILSDEFIEYATTKLLKNAPKFGWTTKKINQVLEQLEEKRLIENQRALLPLFYEKTHTLFDYIPNDTILIIHDPNTICKKAKKIYEELNSLYQLAKDKTNVISSIGELYLTWEEFASKTTKYKRIWLKDYSFLSLEDFEDTINKEKLIEIELNATKSELENLPISRKKDEEYLRIVSENLKDLIHTSHRVILVTPSNKHAFNLNEFLRKYGLNLIDSNKRDEFFEDPQKNGVYLKCYNLSSGFYLKDEGLLIITEDELLGSRTQGIKSSSKKRKEKAISDLTIDDLKPGDYVVHKNYGIGLYHGLTKMRIGEHIGEFLYLEYRGGDKLYLPIDRLNLIQKYIGIEGKEVSLSKLGSNQWILTKEKVKKSLYQIAHDLVELYAQRKVNERPQYSPPDELYYEFEGEFPYEETPDQIKAIEEILEDMLSPYPMDRLLCGDVGVGKTEVIMRAAFKACQDKRQVALLVPTTILAEQHERTFKERFKNFPVNIASISRLKSRKEINEILKKLSEGEIDIIIGTHKLLQPNVRFKNLGLLIIDEEHRFGVNQKETIKKLKKTVDCLSVTATPIPRTLQLSLLELRDMSIIKTPPKDRLPIKSFICEFDPAIIKSAIVKEIERGGQIFFVHNSIKTIDEMADMIKKLVPDIRISIGHGRMDPDQLEDTMIKFIRKEIDCLVCTTIIESGLDIPSANTIIINRADKIGLAELYQLRGRVGRSSEQAYCYLMVPRLADLSPDAAKRLNAIMESELGKGGFNIAMHDLQIRGAGNILGLHQSGHIADVGYEMYLDILMDLIHELKGEPPKEEELDPEVNLAINAFIPDEYIPDVHQRLKIYRRLNKANDEEAIELSNELIDRFGDYPEEVKNLFELMSIKRLLKRLNITRLDRTYNNYESKLTIYFTKHGPPNPDKFLKLVQQNKNWKLTPDNKLIINLVSTNSITKDVYNLLIQLIKNLF